MEVRYNVTGERRRELVQTIAGITEADAKYKGAPTFAYEVDFFTITRDGTLEFSDRSNSEIVEEVLEGIAKAGFECEAAESYIEETTDKKEEPADIDEEDSPETIGLTVSIPPDKVNIGNLTRLLEAKGNLIKKALSIEALPVEVSEDAISFPWFTELPDSDAATAYTHLIAELCRVSKEQSRITATAKDVENEKYAFRCFLLRLGFIGEEYKKDRKILLKNLSGSSAFKGGAKDADAQ